jgi:hypothetical protein
VGANNNNNKQFALNQTIWIGVSFGISIAISMLVPFPLSLFTIIVVFILLNSYIRKRMMKKKGIGGGTLFGSMSSYSSSMVGDSSLRYYCMNCGIQHKQIACPKCGSKMKRVGY